MPKLESGLKSTSIRILNLNLGRIARTAHHRSRYTRYQAYFAQMLSRCSPSCQMLPIEHISGGPGIDSIIIIDLQ